MSVVEIKDVTKQFGDVTALQGIDLEIEEREFVSLIGPSGCGKSTLLRVIGDLIPPTSGTA
ncbi:MAG: ATP-binding cassette domain-containing protein, partial [Gaiellaceae bacterium]